MEQEFEIKKGDVFFATFEQFVGSEQKGARPVVVLQNDVQNKHSPTTIVAPFTKVIIVVFLTFSVFIIYSIVISVCKISWRSYET